MVWIFLRVFSFRYELVVFHKLVQINKSDLERNMIYYFLFSSIQ